MFEVQSFLRANGNFIPVSDFTTEISDTDYIEGAIEIYFCGKGLLTRNHWDYVDQLWAYFVDGLFEVAAGKEFSTYLPDQPIKVTFKPDRHRMRVTLEVVDRDGTRTASVEYNEFIRVMTTQGKAFFNQMAKLVPASRTSYNDIERRLSSLQGTS
jgi:hypothetical protein